jgi:hypothetical protein
MLQTVRETDLGRTSTKTFVTHSRQ